MGRFYKTAKPELLDFMYQVPEQAILGAIKGADTQLEKQEQYLTDFQKQLKQQALDPDVQKQKQKLTEYEDLIKQRSLKISSSPLEALKERQAIRELGNTIYQDVTRGELAAQYGNFAARQKHYEEELKRATDDKGNIRVEDLNEAMRKFDEAFAKQGGTSYDQATGTYKKYVPEKLVNYFDIAEEAKRQAEGWELDVDKTITQQYLDKSGNYLITDTQGREILEKDDLTFGLYNIITTNPEVLNYKNQQVRIRSGAKPGTEEYLQEWERVYGVRQQRGNLGSPFAMESIIQTVTNPETGKTERKPLTQKVQKFDENGKPIEGQFEEKEVKRMVNPGEIFGIAQAQAERKDKEKIVSSVTKEATEPYKVALQQQKEIAVAKAKDLIENPITVIDVKNNQIVSQRFSGNTFSEIKSNLAKSKDGLKVMKDNLKESYLQTLSTSMAKLGSTAQQQKATKDQIDAYIKNEDYSALEKFLQSKGIELPNVTQAAKAIYTTQLAINNNERLLNAQEEKIRSSKEYKEYESKMEKMYGKNYLVLQSKLIEFIDGKIKNEVSQSVETVQGEKWKQSGVINDSEQQELNRGFNYIVKNPLEFITALGQSTDAVINKVGSDGKVKQSFTNINDLLNSYKIPLTQTPQKNTLGEIEELIYTIPGTKENIAIRINRASLIDGNMNNVKVQTAEGVSEQANLGLLPLNVNMEILKIVDGKKVPENINIMTNRNNFRVSNINSVINSNPNIASVSYVQSQVNKAESDYEGLGTGQNNYIQDDYGVKYYPNEAQGTSKGKVVIINSQGNPVEAYGDQGKQLWQNYVKQQK